MYPIEHILLKASYSQNLIKLQEIIIKSDRFKFKI